MAVGHFIRLGDKTTCGGKVLEADTCVTIFGIAHARAGDRVSCGKDNKTYVIQGGVWYIESHGRLVAGTLDSISSCPCKARLIASLFDSSYGEEDPAPRTTRAVAQPAPQPAHFSSTTHAPAAPQPPSGFLMAKQPVPNAISIALRIGVFFDGTGNNAENTALGLACGAHHAITPEDLDASCKPYMSDPESSYGNDLTNIKKMSELYFSSKGLEGEGSSKLAQRMLYVEGIGTQAGEKDSLMGAGTGRGDTGVVGRVQKAFADMASLIDEIVRENPDGEITSLTFDTFGFSRGAAAARHFANEVALGSGGLLERVLISNAKGFSRQFLGQYSRVRPDHPEIVLPGVHSNIGGGYRVEAQEQVLIGPMQGLTVTEGTEVTTTSIYRDALRYKADMIAQGWPASMLEVVTPPPKLLSRDPQDHMAVREQRVYAGLQLKRSVRGELSRVYLRVMYALARQKGVRFKDIPDTPDYRIPAELQPLCDRFVAGDYRVTAAEEALLNLRYIHTSAHWNHPLDKTGQREARLLYINAPTADAVRVQHPHVPD